VFALRVVPLVHRDRIGVVVDRDVRRSPKSTLDAKGRAAAASEGIDDQFSLVNHANNPSLSSLSFCMGVVSPAARSRFWHARHLIVFVAPTGISRPWPTADTSTYSTWWQQPHFHAH
jgi:hypothetical protein